MATKKRKRNAFSKFLLYFLISIILVAIGIYIGKATKKMTTVKLNDPSSYSCPSFKTYRKDEFLEHYKVKRGDTLLSLSASIYNDSSRVSELVAYNKDKYPELSLNNPFIEVGWDLVLPPKNIVVTNDLSNIAIINKTNGAVMEIEDNNGFWWISNGKNKYVVKPDSQTQYLGLTKSDIKEGDCLTFVLLGTKIYSVERQ